MNNDKPTPLEDVRKGLGLLFRAAKAAVEKLETHGVEDVVVTSAREVGRAIENVATAIEREVFGKKGDPPRAPKSDPPTNEAEDGRSPPNDPKPPT